MKKLLVLTGAVLLLTACSSTTQAVNAGFPLIEPTKQQIIDMPDGFGDIVTACHGSTRLYLSSTGGQAGRTVGVLANDGSCQ